MSDNESNTNYTTPSRNLVAQASDFETQTSPASSRPVSYIQSPNTPTPEPRVFRPRPKSETFAKKDHVVRFADPQTDDAEELDIPQRLRSPSSTWTAHSEDDSAYSELSDGNIGTSMQPRKRRRRAPRSAMRYLVAQPPTPKHRRFIHARPKLLLQLQQFTDVRPKPAFDVLSSNVLRGSLLGSSSMMNRFPRLLGRGAHLGPNDLIVAESEDYDSLTPVDDHDPLSNRELLAVISPRIAPEGGTDIVLADGSIWTAYQMPNASYEFHNINEDGHTVIARWVKRKIAFEDEEHYKYTFSLIDRATRRHPILGTLTQSTLEVLNQYTTGVFKPRLTIDHERLGERVRSLSQSFWFAVDPQRPMPVQ
ncbi:unnamed protein product [Parascedosporium putredinis]|uniref:Uncharacterized protein n=1 Tax=Parascedosporium putredinis TaxID=1442378 RepID=A0A9P1MD66_9PEZI|nr:unnamed protein product [Parascedosporium putredinis]CAI7999841.1 unnamed protein product [Parascedosporium putredinis]